jgi:hypothetical protein
MSAAALTSLLHLEDAEDLPWHIDPKDKDPRPEEKRQLAFLRDARILCPGVNIFSVPNGGRRTQWEINKAKREGMKSGALDLVATWNRGVAFLEFKNGTDQPTSNQRDQLNTLYRQGHHCGVFRQEQSALEFLRSAGAPFIGRIAA